MKELLIPDESVVLSIFRLYVVLFLVTRIKIRRSEKPLKLIVLKAFILLILNTTQKDLPQT